MQKRRTKRLLVIVLLVVALVVLVPQLTGLGTLLEDLFASNGGSPGGDVSGGGTAPITPTAVRGVTIPGTLDF